MAACVCGSARKLAKFSMELTAKGNVVTSLGKLIGGGDDERTLRGTDARYLAH